MLVVREILEIGAQLSVEVRDVAAFERYMAYLKTYYMDYSKDLPESAKMYELLGLNLLRLLSQNRLVSSSLHYLLKLSLSLLETKSLCLSSSNNSRVAGVGQPLLIPVLFVMFITQSRQMLQSFFKVGEPPPKKKKT